MVWSSNLTLALVLAEVPRSLASSPRMAGGASVTQQPTRAQSGTEGSLWPGSESPAGHGRADSGTHLAAQPGNGSRGMSPTEPTLWRHLPAPAHQACACGGVPAPIHVPGLWCLTRSQGRTQAGAWLLARDTGRVWRGGQKAWLTLHSWSRARAQCNLALPGQHMLLVPRSPTSHVE